MARIGNPIGNQTSGGSSSDDTTSQDTTSSSSSSSRDEEKRRQGARRSVGQLQQQDSLIDDTTGGSGAPEGDEDAFQGAKDTTRGDVATGGSTSGDGGGGSGGSGGGGPSDTPSSPQGSPPRGSSGDDGGVAGPLGSGVAVDPTDVPRGSQTGGTPGAQPPGAGATSGVTIAADPEVQRGTPGADRPLSRSHAGLETQRGRLNKQANELETQWLSENPEFSASDVIVVRGTDPETGEPIIKTKVAEWAIRREAKEDIATQFENQLSGADFEAGDIELTPTDDGGFTGSLSESGQSKAKPIVEERTSTALTGLGFEGTKETGLVAPEAAGRDSIQEQHAETVLEGVGFEGVDTDQIRAPDAAGTNTLQERKQQAQLRNTLEGIGVEGTRDDGFQLPESGEETLRERKAQETTNDTLEGIGIEGTPGDRRGPSAGLSREERKVQNAIQEAEAEAETGSFTLSVAGRDFTLGGQVRDVDPVMQEDGSITFETQERSSISEDFDWSLGFGDPDTDEVEDAFRTTNEFFVAKATSVGEHTTAETDGVEVGTTKGIFSESLIAEGLEAAGFEEEAETLESTGREFVGKSVQGVASIPAIATAVPLAIMEGSETIGTGTKRAGRGEGVEFFSDLADATGGMLGGGASKVAANPAGTAGLLAGSLVGTAGVFRAARALGPRASTATRFAIQPGEEILGRGGFAATKKLRGEASAQRFFPNKEPLIFSEEAAIRGGRRGLGKLRQAADADSLSAFRRSERAQGRLTGGFRRAESEIELKDREALSEVEDAAEQRRDQFRLKTNIELEKRREREPDAEPPEGRTLPEKEFDTLSKKEFSTVSGGPDVSRSGPTRRQQAAHRAQVGDSADAFDLSPREKQLAAQLETPQTDLRTRAAETGDAETRIEAVQEPQVRVDDQFSGTAAKEVAVTGIDEQLGQEAAFDTEFGQLGETDAFLAMDSELGAETETGVDSLMESGVDVLAETEQGIGTDLELDSEVEPAFEFEGEQEQRLGFETDAEQEFEFEQEQEFEFEQEQEFETELDFGGKKSSSKKDDDAFGFDIEQIEFEVLAAEDLVFGGSNK